MNAATALRLIWMPRAERKPAQQPVENPVQHVEMVAMGMDDRQMVELGRCNPIGDPELESTFLRTGWTPRVRR